jgi:mycothiol synthase
VEADFRVLLEGERIVGWCDVWDQNKAHKRLFLDVRALPEDSGVRAELFDWGLARARALAVKGAVCRAWGESVDTGFAHEVERRGFRLIRHFFRMEADVAKEPQEPAWPARIDVRTFRPGEARAVYEAICDAFADHWFVFHSSSFDPTLWFIAESDGEIAGFSLCRFERRPGVGHVGVLGVRPPWRRRGLGLALLLHSFRELRGRGRTKVDLGVDAENTTGAVHLYERAGMTVARQTDSYELALT